MKTQIAKLTKITLATWIHGITGQEIDEGLLPVGALVKNIVTTELVDGGVQTDFLASTDRGATWYAQRAWSALDTEIA